MLFEIKYDLPEAPWFIFAQKVIVNSSPGLKLKSPLWPILIEEDIELSKSIHGKLPSINVCSEKLTLLYSSILKK